jgi:solute carrier family 25 uncoupling protein 8/9
MDTAKVRLQISGISGEKKYNGLLGTMKTIVKEEGIKALFKGLSSGLCRQIVFCSIRIGSYDTVRNAIVPIEQRNSPNLMYKIFAGLATGAIGILIANPTDVVKIRL